MPAKLILCGTVGVWACPDVVGTLETTPQIRSVVAKNLIGG
jgi:hypothetical protein